MEALLFRSLASQEHEYEVVAHPWDRPAANTVRLLRGWVLLAALHPQGQLTRETGASSPDS